MYNTTYRIKVCCNLLSSKSNQTGIHVWYIYMVYHVVYHGIEPQAHIPWGLFLKKHIPCSIPYI